jgi:histidine triad (HIT) family protein
MDQKEMQEKIKNMSPEELREFQKQQCVFCHIISGKVPSKKVYEDDKCLAILDINPANIGHILLLPKEHYMIMPQVPEEIMGHLAIIAKQLSNICLKAFQCQGTNIFVANGLVAGQKAQHFMIHIIPRFEGDDISFNIPEQKLQESQLKQIKEILKQKISALMGVDIEEESEKSISSKSQDKPITQKPKEDKIEEEIEKVEEEAEETEKILKKLSGEKIEKKNNKKADLDKISKLFS